MGAEDEEITGIWGSEAEEFSADITVVPFDPPLPLLREPLPAGASDDPSVGRFVLAFADAAAWRRTYQTTESKLRENCEAGARVGCSITACKKCRGPWWRNLFGATAMSFAERKECEDREMASCLATSKDACTCFAKEKCLRPFQEARISLINQETIPQPDLCGKQIDDFLVDISKDNLEVTNYRGSVLLVNSDIEKK